jgi:hypothetical protein
MINLYRNSFCVLIVCSLFNISPQTVSNPFFELQTTPGGLFQTPTGMSGLQSQTNTPTDTPTVTPTTTLIPLPAITLIFPAHTTTPVITQKPTPILETATQIPDSENIYDSGNPRVRLIVIVLGFLWLILASYLIIYIRQFR